MNKAIDIFILLVVLIAGVYLSGHVNANNADYCDCKPTAIPTISILPQCEEWQQDCPSPSVSVIPTNSPTASPSAFIFPTPTEGSGGFFDDHLGCGTHSCVGSSVSANVPTAAPNTGRAK